MQRLNYDKGLTNVPLVCKKLAEKETIREKFHPELINNHHLKIIIILYRKKAKHGNINLKHLKRFT